MDRSYPAHLVRVLDSDAVRLDVELGFNLRGTFDVQLARLDAPEVIGKRASAGKDTKNALKEMLRQADSILVRPTGVQTGAGRWWAEVDVVDAAGAAFCVSDQLLQLGLADPREG